MAITIKDIAREAGYAVGTVSRVLNNHPDVSQTAREKIMEVVEKHHFELNKNAKHLKQQTSKGIAIIIKGSQNMLFASIVEQMQGMLTDKSLDCLVYYINETENEVETAVRLCAERRPAGIMFLGCNMQYFRDRFAAITVPCVLVTNSAKSLDFLNLSKSQSLFERKNPRILPAAEYIKKNYDTKITNAFLADLCNMSVTHFRRIFKENFGVSPMQYHEKIRMHWAVIFLQSRMFTVSEISEKLGYSDVYYFSNTFKKHTGNTPSYYKNK